MKRKITGWRHGMACPRCDNQNQLYVMTDSVGYWDDDSYCLCSICFHVGALRFFKLEMRNPVEDEKRPDDEAGINAGGN